MVTWSMVPNFVSSIYQNPHSSFLHVLWFACQGAVIISSNRNVKHIFYIIHIYTFCQYVVLISSVFNVQNKFLCPVAVRQ